MDSSSDVSLSDDELRLLSSALDGLIEAHEDRSDDRFAAIRLQRRIGVEIECRADRPAHEAKPVETVECPECHGAGVPGPRPCSACYNRGTVEVDDGNRVVWSRRSATDSSDRPVNMGRTRSPSNLIYFGAPDAGRFSYGEIVVWFTPAMAREVASHLVDLAGYIDGDR